MGVRSVSDRCQIGVGRSPRPIVGTARARYGVQKHCYSHSYSVYHSRIYECRSGHSLTQQPLLYCPLLSYSAPSQAHVAAEFVETELNTAEKWAQVHACFDSTTHPFAFSSLSSPPGDGISDSGVGWCRVSIPLLERDSQNGDTVTSFLSSILGVIEIALPFAV